MRQGLESWTDEFERFASIFRPCVRREDTFANIQLYLTALLLDVERKNTWQMAEAVGLLRPDRFQRLLSKATWDSELFNQTLIKLAIQQNPMDEAIVVLDETGFIKKGVKSVGVKRQYTGTTGKVDNCQIGVFAGLVLPDQHLLIDKRLYLPREWCADSKRREEAGVPEDIEFQTKGELAQSMLTSIQKCGLTPKWITGDEVYGRPGTLRDQIRQSGSGFVLAIPGSMKIWTDQGELGECVGVKDFVSLWADHKWRKLKSLKGEKGELNYQWSCQVVYENRNGKIGDQIVLLARRSVSNPSEVSFYFCHNPTNAGLLELAKVVVSRAKIEQCFKEAKQETGLDECEVRFWNSWHRHMTLSMISFAFLGRVKTVSKKKCLRNRQSQA